MLEIYLIRHAQSTGNVQHDIITGQSNELDLTDLGKQQAAALGRRLQKEGLHFDRLIASRAVRAKKTALAVCNKMGLDKNRLEIFDEITELTFGKWEGLPTKDVFTKETYQKFLDDTWNFRLEGAESAKEVEARMSAWLTSEIITKSKDSDRILIVSHGTAIRCLLQGILEFNPKMLFKIQMKNTAINKLRYDKIRGWFLDRMNDVGHLK